MKLYEKYHLSREDTRLGLFVELDKKFSIQKVLYPGSFVHITPSLVFPEVVYVDSYKKAKGFYADPQVQKFIDKNKQYCQESVFKFHLSDYAEDFGEPEASFDLLVSQYGGFVSHYCKKYLKKGGILVVNNSHGDAGLANFDPEFELVGVYNRRTDIKYSISDKDLGSYFIPKKKDLEVTKTYLWDLGKGIGYTKGPSGYIFRKVN